MPRRLTVSIRPDGTIAAEASGTPGPDCLDAIDQLRALLNAEPTDSKPTPEFSMIQQPVQPQTQAAQNLEEQS